MAASREKIDRICITVTALMLIVTVLFMNGSYLGISATQNEIGYESRIFDTSYVHEISIVMDDWDSFIETCENEDYSSCSIIIDGEAYKNVGIRAKGNTSLSQVRQSGGNRYSFKVEFDQYDNTGSYYGLDKLVLNNIIQDNTYMKDYLTYQMMLGIGAAAPLCSYAFITVNGEDWGLYLALEAIEDSFLLRNYGADHGELYKPDGLGMGGGKNRENGGNNFAAPDFSDIKMPSRENGGADFAMPEGNFAMPEGDFAMPEGDFSMFEVERSGGEEPSGRTPNADRGFFGGGMGQSDAKLQYIDDNINSYSTIFDSAKTDVTDADKERLIASLKQLSEYRDLEEILDIDAVIRYFVVHNFVCNGDSYTGSMIHNYYLYEEEGRMQMLPWDYNLAYGSFHGGSNATSTVNDPIDTPISGSMDDRPMVAWIFSNEEYTEMYHEVFAEFLDRVDIIGIIDSTEALIDEYVKRDPTKFCTYEEFSAGVEMIRMFCEKRIQSVLGQLDSSIPSTDEGQKADSSALIDASDISISAMGSMGMGGMDRTKRGETEAQSFDAKAELQPPNKMTETEKTGSLQDAPVGAPQADGAQQGAEKSQSGEAMHPSESTRQSENIKPSRAPQGDRENTENPQGAFPISSQSGNTAAQGSEQWILLAVSAIVLILGLFVAIVYKR